MHGKYFNCLTWIGDLLYYQARRQNWGALLPRYHAIRSRYRVFHHRSLYRENGSKICRHDLDASWYLHRIPCGTGMDQQHDPTSPRQARGSYRNDQCRLQLLANLHAIRLCPGTPIQ